MGIDGISPESVKRKGCRMTFILCIVVNLKHGIYAPIYGILAILCHVVDRPTIRSAIDWYADKFVHAVD